MIRVAIIGFGYWGPNLVRNFLQTSGCEVSYVADERQERLEQVNKLYPTINTVNDANEVIGNNDVDAVVIATPVFTHYELAKSHLYSRHQL